MIATRTIEKKESVHGARIGRTELTTVEKASAAVLNQDKQDMTTKMKVSVTAPTSFLMTARALSPPPLTGLPENLSVNVTKTDQDHQETSTSQGTLQQ
eukprot:3710870-Rhodomonas_salina.2